MNSVHGSTSERCPLCDGSLMLTGENGLCLSCSNRLCKPATPAERVQRIMAEHGGMIDVGEHRRAIEAEITFAERSLRERVATLESLCQRLRHIVVGEFSCDGQDEKSVKRYQEIVDEAGVILRSATS